MTLSQKHFSTGPGQNMHQQLIASDAGGTAQAASSNSHKLGQRAHTQDAAALDLKHQFITPAIRPMATTSFGIPTTHQL
jgi:hypothetical protein